MFGCLDKAMKMRRLRAALLGIALCVAVVGCGPHPAEDVSTGAPVAAPNTSTVSASSANTEPQGSGDRLPVPVERGTLEPHEVASDQMLSSALSFDAGRKQLDPPPPDSVAVDVKYATTELLDPAGNPIPLTFEVEPEVKLAVFTDTVSATLDKDTKEYHLKYIKVLVWALVYRDVPVTAVGGATGGGKGVGASQTVNSTAVVVVNATTGYAMEQFSEPAQQG